MVEFACERIDDAGAVIERYETLIDPGRNPGRSDVHGLAVTDVRGAPVFRDVAREIAKLFHGTVPVAHNLRFDWTVLRSEYGRCGIALPILPRGVCTGTLARGILGGRASLDAVCQQLGIERPRRHEAGVDATAARQVFAALRVIDMPRSSLAPCDVFAGWWRLPPPHPPHPRSGRP